MNECMIQSVNTGCTLRVAKVAVHRIVGLLAITVACILGFLHQKDWQMWTTVLGNVYYNIVATEHLQVFPVQLQFVHGRKGTR